MSSRSDLNFRIEQYHNIEELLERARTLDQTPVPATSTSTVAEVEKPETRGQVQIAHPNRPDFSKQLDDNMRGHAFNPEAISRNPDIGNKVVVKTSGRSHDFGHPAHHGSPVGVKLGRARQERKPRTERTDLDNPSWTEFGVAGRFIQEEAAQAIARLEHAAGHTFSRQSMSATGKGGETTPAEQAYFDATGSAAPNDDTNAKYDYQGDSAWQRRLAELGPAPGTVQAGEGAPLAPSVVAEVTKTFAKDPKKA